MRDQPARRPHRLIRLGLLALGLFSVLWARAGEDGAFPHHRSDLPDHPNATIGNYLYVGVAPRFEPEDLLLVSSKIGLTLRVNAGVTAELRSRYAKILYHRFHKIADAFLSQPKMGFYLPESPSRLEKRAKGGSTRLWAEVVAPYARHVLQGHGIDFDGPRSDAIVEKKNVLTAILRYYFQDDTLTLDSIPVIEQKLADPAQTQAWSKALFDAHLGSRFTPVPWTEPKSGKSYVGTLTYVYPIAATAEGPFDQPSEGIRGFGNEGLIEARIWSDKWKDEFGGFPFLLVDWSGVAFHGPISNFEPLDVWYLRRDYVSHGCMRMDSSDVLELRAMMPSSLADLERRKRQVKHVTLTWPDVTDWDADGKDEVVDVDYYDIPTWLPAPKKGASLEALSKKYQGASAQAAWRKHHYTAYNHSLNAQGTPVFNPTTGIYSGLPLYEFHGNSLVRAGTRGPVPVHVFPYQPNRILQYFDGRPFPEGFENRTGKYSPFYFVQD